MKKLILLLIPFFLLLSCAGEKEESPITIGISKGAPDEYYGNYAAWIQKADSNIICIDLYHMPFDSALLLLDNCSGLLLSGGPDVFPGRYDAPEDTVLCETIDFYRDTLEFALIKKAKELKMPVLGICRGLQIFNIYHGGSLYADIPTQLDTLISHRCTDTYNCFHDVRITEGSSLHSTSGVKFGNVNSNHHQGIRRIGDGISAMARTDDGLIEAIGYTDLDKMPFFMGVQWHPERMDISSPLSLPIAMYFLQEAKLWEKKKQELIDIQ
jgi:putative glutamine amidotransferase